MFVLTYFDILEEVLFQGIDAFSTAIFYPLRVHFRCNSPIVSGQCDTRYKEIFGRQRLWDAGGNVGLIFTSSKSATPFKVMMYRGIGERRCICLCKLEVRQGLIIAMQGLI